MAKARDIPSIEQGLHEAFRILKDAGIEEAIKNFTEKQKSASFYRNCSDPDEIHKIDHADSLAIDYECLKTKGIAPMLSAHEALVTKFLLNQNSIKISVKAVFLTSYILTFPVRCLLFFATFADVYDVYDLFTTFLIF